MAKKKRNELAAGVFVILVIGVALGVVLWLGAADLFRPRGQRVHFWAPESAGSLGVREGNFVMIGDARVGQVVEVRYLPRQGRTLYLAELRRRDVKVFADAEAAVELPFIGAPTIVISSRGTADAGPADKDDPIPLRRGGVMGGLAEIARRIGSEFDRSNRAGLLGRIHEIVGELEGASRNVATIVRTVKEETNAEKTDSLLRGLRRSVADLNGISSTLAREVDPDVAGSLLARVHETMADVQGLAGNVRTETDRSADGSLVHKAHASMDHVNALTGGVGPKVDRILTSAAKTAEKVEQYTNEDIGELLKKLHATNARILEIATNFKTVSGEAEEIVRVHRDNIDEMIDNMAQVSANLKATSKEVRRSPWRLIHKPSEKEIRSQDIYDAAHAFSNGAEQLDQAVSKLRGLAETHPEGIPADDPTYRKVREHLDETFRKFSKAEQALWNELSK